MIIPAYIALIFSPFHIYSVYFTSKTKWLLVLKESLYFKNRNEMKVLSLIVLIYETIRKKETQYPIKGDVSL